MLVPMVEPIKTAIALSNPRLRGSEVRPLVSANAGSSLLVIVSTSSGEIIDRFDNRQGRTQVSVGFPCLAWFRQPGQFSHRFVEVLFHLRGLGKLSGSELLKLQLCLQ